MTIKPANIVAQLPLLASILLLAACTGPDVSTTDPIDTAVGAARLRPVTATFARPMTASTIDGTSFTLTGPNGPVSGAVTFDAGTNKASFAPAAPLLFNSDYTARLSTAIKDAAGNPFPADYVWRFNTGKKLTAGGFHTCARLVDDRLKCWGSNELGELGLGHTIPRGFGPNQMGANLRDVNLGTGRTVSQIAAGAFHNCARLDNGQVKCWGDNLYGQVGLGDNFDHKIGIGDEPSEMGDNLPALDLGAGRTAVELAAGFDHTCARLDNGQVKCWGRNDLGQLGLGDNTGGKSAIGDQANEMGDSLPAVDLGAGRTAAGLVAGNDHTCARLDGGQVKCWGDNVSGQLGIGDTSGDKRLIGDQPNEMGDNLPAVDLGAGRTAVELVAGSGHTCARLDNGQVKCWGDNVSGQLGIGDNTGDKSAIGDQPGEMGDALQPVDLGSPGGFPVRKYAALQLVAGSLHTCARLADPGALIFMPTRIKCWGNNNDGQIGLGDTSGDKTSIGDQPNEMGNNLPLVDLGQDSQIDLPVLELAAGLRHTCVHLGDAPGNTTAQAGGVPVGRVKCSGLNLDGQLGLGDIDARGDGPAEMGNNLPVVDIGEMPNILITDSIAPATDRVVDFGRVLRGATRTATVTIANNGSADLFITSSSISGSSLHTVSARSCGGSAFIVPPGTSCSLQVKFSSAFAATVGIKSAVLRIVSSDADEPVVNVSLSANVFALQL